jgi:hypothetical protein
MSAAPRSLARSSAAAGRFEMVFIGNDLTPCVCTPCVC